MDGLNSSFGGPLINLMHFAIDLGYYSLDATSLSILYLRLWRIEKFLSNIMLTSGEVHLSCIGKVGLSAGVASVRILFSWSLATFSF
jgi:hypothetical protein